MISKTLQFRFLALSIPLLLLVSTALLAGDIQSTLFNNPDGRNSAALNAAIQQCQPGDILRLPAGTFDLRESVKMKSGIKLIGAGQDKTIFTYSGEKSEPFILVNDCQDIEIGHLTLVVWDSGGRGARMEKNVEVLPAARPLKEAVSLGLPVKSELPARAGRVRVVDHSLVDDNGPFLGLGVSYFTALRRYHNERPRLESDLGFLSQQGFNYTRILSMVGWNRAWDGLEIAPIAFTSHDGKKVDAWPDYWQSLAGLVDLSYDRFGIRTQITIFADAQLMPNKIDRIEHMRRMLAEVVAGREHKIILLEVANEAWQNGFPGDEGTADLREFTRYLAERTQVPLAITSNHEGSFETLYRDSAADIATWHFSRDRSADEGWRPVIDCRRLAQVVGCPPVSSNEPIGPGSSVSSESDTAKLVLAAAYAYASRLPMYVFHSQAGVFGKTRFEDTPAIGSYRHIARILPNDLTNWKTRDGNDPDSPVGSEGCLTMACNINGDQFVCIPVGIRPGGLTLTARMPMDLRVIDLLTGKEITKTKMTSGQRVTLPAASGAWVLMGTVEHAQAK